MARELNATREELEEFIEFVKDPLPKFVPDWEYLNPRQQQVFRRLVYADISYRELAQELHITHQTLKNHVWQATRRIRTRPGELRGQLIEKFQEMADEFI